MDKQFSNIDFQKIISGFKISGANADAQPTGDGHINDTFLVKTDRDDLPDYILQRINHDIFKDVPKMMENILRVSSHLKQKIEAGDDYPGTEKVLELILTNDLKPFLLDKEGNYWRCFKFCEGSCTQIGDYSQKQAKEGGKALARFQHHLLDLPGGPLHDTIPKFHDLSGRMVMFEEAIKIDALGRLSNSKSEVVKMLDRKQEMLAFNTMARDGSIPWRITHNDTKFNNVLFNKNEEALCLIDLDTVMNGTVLYDFGDVLRTLGNTAEEDEADLSKVGFNMKLFASFARGYLAEADKFLSKIELEYLAFSARFLTYIIGLRFLTDYLKGDVYFKTAYPEHNLVRTRNQIKLLESMEENFEEMERIVSGITGN